MAGKPPVFCDHLLFVTLDDVSKNQLIDLAVDLCRAEIGESASNESVLFLGLIISILLKSNQNSTCEEVD